LLSVSRSPEKQFSQRGRTLLFTQGACPPTDLLPAFPPPRGFYSRNVPASYFVAFFLVDLGCVNPVGFQSPFFSLTPDFLTWPRSFPLSSPRRVAALLQLIFHFLEPSSFRVEKTKFSVLFGFLQPPALWPPPLLQPLFFFFQNSRRFLCLTLYRVLPFLSLLPREAPRFLLLFS